MKPLPSLLALSASLSVLGGSLFSDTLNWTGEGADGNIVTYDNWSGTEGTPTTITTADILVYESTLGTQQTIVISDSLNIAGLQVQTPLGLSTSPSILQTGGTLSITAPSGETIPGDAGLLLLGTNDSATASYEITGGTLSISGGKLSSFGTSSHDIGIAIGHNRGSGTFTLSGDTSSIVSEGRILVGSTGGSGIFIQNGGTVTTKGLIVGEGNFTDLATTEEGTSGNYQMTGGSLTINDQRFTIGRFGTGSFVQDGGTVTANGGLYIGDNIGVASDGETAVRGNGTYELKNNGKLSGSGMLLGWQGEGTFTHTSGTVSLGWLTIGQSSATVNGTLYRGEGAYDMSAGSLILTGDLTIGHENGTGIFTLNDGTVTVGGILQIGREEGTGTFIQEGGSVTLTGSKFRIGGIDGNASTSTGTYTLKAGSLSIEKDMLIGNAGSTGTLNIQGGTLTQTGNWLVLGKDSNGVGHLNQTGGTFSTTAILELGRNEALDSEGNHLASTVNISGASTQATFNEVRIGLESDSSKGGYGTFTVENNALSTIDGNLYIGYDKKGTGEFHIKSGAEVEAKKQVVLGYWDNAEGTLTVSDGILTIGQKLTLGDRASGKGTINLSSGEITISKADDPDNAATRLGSSGGIGIINQTGGIFNSLNSDVIIYASNDARGSGTWNLSGTGQANFRRLVVGEYGSDTAGASIFKLGNGTTGGTLTVGEIHSASNSNSSFIFNGGTLVAAANAVESGSGDFLSANLKNLVILSDGSVIDTNGKNISFGRGFTGSGNLTKEGTGTLTLKGDHTGYTGSLNVAEGDVAFAAGAKVLFNINATNTEADNLYTFADGSTVALDDSVILQIALANESSLFLGQTFDLFKGSSVNIANASQIQVLINNATYDFILNSQGQLVVTAIPEPSTYALVAASSLLGLLALRRRQQ